MRRQIQTNIRLFLTLCGLAACTESLLANDDDLQAISSQDACGIRVVPMYIGEVFSNTRGGLNTNDATRYLGQLNLAISLDGAAVSSSLPGHFHLLAQNTHGQGLTTNFVGDTQVVSNIDAYRNIMQVSEYWWEGSSLDELITFRLGKQEFNTEFLAIETASDFVQSTFGLSPSTAFPTYPNQSFGAVLILKLAESWRLKSGVWDAFSRGGNWGFSGNSSAIAAAELEYSYALGGGLLPGIVSFGAVYEAGERVDGERISAVYEYVFQIEQALYREDTAGEFDQGCSVFLGLYPRSSGDEVAEDSIGNSMVAGVVFRGPFEERDQDSLGVGLAWSELYRGGTNQEKVVEMYYRARMTHRVTLQPDMQYIATPSGIYRDAFAVGTRMQIQW